MRSILIVGPGEREAIAEAIRRARANPIPWEVVSAIAVDDRDNPTATLKLAERRGPEGTTRFLKENYPSHGVELGTYRAAITFERQPAGLLRHLSVSTARRGELPDPTAFALIVDEFGFSGFPPKRSHRLWIEEFEPGHEAVNLVELEE